MRKKLSFRKPKRIQFKKRINSLIGLAVGAGIGLTLVKAASDNI